MKNVSLVVTKFLVGKKQRQNENSETAIAKTESEDFDTESVNYEVVEINKPPRNREKEDRRSEMKADIRFHPKNANRI